ncbi:hypothetical protein [Caulobacter sp. 17J65-9]|uniref:hypothetical protein n=1 Tax=Caulobacter sp. 17J65-9 TaxID=2709382 RepID=UPI0013C7105E|nr:hypothetical protein [Caulobacter sp. 17J65-9]NEX93618.1 hypothetical protein [Caulobacter sp. 17J65-9]
MTQFQYDLVQGLETAAFLLAVSYALWRGDRSARGISLVYIGGYLAMWAAFFGGKFIASLSATPVRYASRFPELAVDVAALALITVLALRNPRPWLLWSAAFQLVSTATRTAGVLDRSIDRLAVVTAVNTWWVLQLAVLAWGTVEASRARRTGEAAA